MGAGQRHTWGSVGAFAMHSSKSYLVNSDKTAAIAYRVRLGFAVVSGDPIGDATQITIWSPISPECAAAEVGRSSYWPAAKGTWGCRATRRSGSRCWRCRSGETSSSMFATSP